MKHIVLFLLLPFLSFSQDFAVAGTALAYQGGQWVEMPVENILAMMDAAPGPLYIGETDINDPANGIYYIHVVINGILNPYIDYGAAESIRDMRRKEIKDGEGNTPGPRQLEVFNFLARNGWEYVDTPAPDTYLFKKKETK